MLKSILFFLLVADPAVLQAFRGFPTGMNSIRIFLQGVLLVSLLHAQGNCEAPNPVTCPCHYPRMCNPVCGDDNVTYDNKGVIRCVNRCNNSNVQVLYKGVCGSPITKPPSA